MSMRIGTCVSAAVIAGCAFFGVAAVLAQPAPKPGPELALPAPPPVVGPVELEAKSIKLEDAFCLQPLSGWDKFVAGVGISPARKPLANCSLPVKGHVFHTARIELPPGATTPVYGAQGHPAIIYVAEGLVMEHQEGQPAVERQVSDTVFASKGAARTFENASARPAILVVSQVD